MKKKILALIVGVSAVFGVTAFADGWNYLDMYSNELFDVVGEITEEEYNTIGDDSKYPALRDEKYEYNDGLKLGNYNYEEIYIVDGKEQTGIYPVSALYDINGEIVFSNPQIEMSAMGYFFSYNLGYVCERMTMINGSMDGFVYDIRFINTQTNEQYQFDSFDCMLMDNDGIMLFEQNGRYFKAQLKKPAIVTVWLDGKKLYFDQIPRVEEGRTLVPLRAIFEELGAVVEWNGETKTVTAVKGDTTVSLTVDSKTAVKNGENIELDVPAKVINGRTLVPVRFIADCFGVGVDWDGDMWKVILTSK